MYFIGHQKDRKIGVYVGGGEEKNPKGLLVIHTHDHAFFRERKKGKNRGKASIKSKVVAADDHF